MTNFKKNNVMFINCLGLLNLIKPDNTSLELQQKHKRHSIIQQK